MGPTGQGRYCPLYRAADDRATSGRFCAPRLRTHRQARWVLRCPPAAADELGGAVLGGAHRLSRLLERARDRLAGAGGRSRHDPDRLRLRPLGALAPPVPGGGVGHRRGRVLPRHLSLGGFSFLSLSDHRLGVGCGPALRLAASRGTLDAWWAERAPPAHDFHPSSSGDRGAAICAVEPPGDLRGSSCPDVVVPG